MPAYNHPRNDEERVDFEQRKALIKRRVNLAFEASGLSKRDFSRRCFPYSLDIESHSKNIYNWLKTGQISKPMLIPFAKAADVPVEFLLGEDDKIVEWELEARIRRKSCL